MRLALKWFTATLLCMCLCGCATIRGPKLPAAFIITKPMDQKIVSEIKNYQNDKCVYSDTRNCPKDRLERDQIIYNLAFIITSNYQDYAKGFEGTEDGSAFAGEIISTTLSGTAGIVGAVATKDILSLASSLTTSTSVSAQKNFYQKQTAYTIMVEMDAERASVWKDISGSMRDNDLNTYPLGAALTDLARYRQAGTALQALAAITQKAGADAAQSKTDIDKIKKQPIHSY